MTGLAESASVLDGSLAEIVRETFGVMLAFELFEQPGGAVARTGHTSLVHITGELPHTVLLTFGPHLGDRITAELFEMPPDELDDEARADALGELANVIGGGIKSLLPSFGQLSLPTVTLGESVPIIIGAVQTDLVTFTDGHDTLTVAVWKRQDSATPDRGGAAGATGSTRPARNSVPSRVSWSPSSCAGWPAWIG